MQPWRRWALWSLVLGLAGCTPLIEALLVYHPAQDLMRSPRDVGLAYEDLWFAAEDGVRLHGWFLPAPGAATTTVLWFHGNAGNIGRLLDKARLLHQRLGVHLFVFDYRGYGRSDGRPCEAGLYRDARAALAAARGHPLVRSDRVIYFGESLGAGVAVELATRERPLGLVLEAPFLSVRAMGHQWFPPPLVNLLVCNLYDSARRMAQVRAPLLILHGEEDGLVPLEHGRILFEAGGGPKTFVPLAGAGHSDLHTAGGAAYLEAWARFLAVLERAGSGAGGSGGGQHDLTRPRGGAIKGASQLQP